MLAFRIRLRRLDAAQAQHARKIYTRSALKYNVSVLFKIGYISILMRIQNIAVNSTVA